MNVIKRIYARTFEGVLRLALPLLPYKNPIIIKSTKDIPAILGKDGKPIIVTDKVIASLDFTAELFEDLRSKDIPITLFSDVEVNPTTREVERARKAYIENGCNCIIAVGGGSSLDTAKGLGARIARPKKSLAKMKGILKVRKKIPLLIAIPTTAGTGSETTLATVITDENTRHKYAINDFPLIPKYAVLDEKATATLPKHIVSTTGVDALTHAVEAFIGRSTTRQTRKDSLDAIKLIFEFLIPAYRVGDEQSRKNMLYASHLAGRAFSKSYVGYVHSLAHALGGKYNTPHGLANAVLLPYVLKAYGKKIYKKLKIIALYCGFVEKEATAEQGAMAFFERLEKLLDSLNIPKTLPEIKQGDLDLLVGYAYSEAFPLYPVPVLWDKKQLKEIYLKVMENRNDSGAN